MIKIATCDDWQALYIDDVLIQENHSLDKYFLLKVGKENPNKKTKYYYVSEEYAEDTGCFPKNFNDFPKEVLEEVDDE